MRTSHFLLGCLTVVAAACNDATGSGSLQILAPAVAQYTFVDYSTSSDWTPLTPVVYPFSPALAFIDSLHDTITLREDGTYDEQGGLWTTSAAGADIVITGRPIRANGTYRYQLDGVSIMLIPSDSSLVHGGIATLDVVTGVLAVPRYPGTWTFAQHLL